MKLRLSLIVVFFALLAACTLQARPITVGVVLSTGGLQDGSFNDAAYDGALQLRKEGDTLVEIIDPGSVAGIEPALRYFCERKKDMVCAVGVFANDAVRHVAADYPDSHIVLIDSAVNAPNVLSILFDEEQGSFFAGAYAALVTKTRKIGFLGGMNSEVIQGFERGFNKGATFVNPDITLVSRYLGDSPDAFDMPEKASEVSADFTANKVDVVYHAAGKSGLGLIKNSRVGGYYVIGVDSDQSKVAPGRVVASVVKRIDIALVKAAEVMKKDAFKGGIWTLGLADHGIELALSRFNKDLLTPEVSSKVDEIEDFVIQHDSK